MNKLKIKIYIRYNNDYPYRLKEPFMWDLYYDIFVNKYFIEKLSKLIYL